jgi:hypothetical protein
MRINDLRRSHRFQQRKQPCLSRAARRLHTNHKGIFKVFHVKVHMPLYVVLVINDNFNGLIVLLSLIWKNRLQRMLEDHVLDSRLNAINIKIYFKYWYQDHRFEEMNMIWSIDLEFLCGTPRKPCEDLYVNLWRFKILRVWLQKKNSSDGSMPR